MDRSNQGLMPTELAKFLRTVDSLRLLLRSTLQSMSLAIPVSFHQDLMAEAVKLGARSERHGSGRLSWWRYWRAVEMNEEGIKRVGNLGYWVREGLDDLPTNAVGLLTLEVALHA